MKFLKSERGVAGFGTAHCFVDLVFFTRFEFEDADITSMRSLLFFLITVVSSQLVQAQIPRQSFYFNYLSKDETAYLDCGYSPVTNEPEVFKVVCGKGTTFIKTFTVRFRVRPIGTITTKAYEVIYWVSNGNNRDHWNEGSTAWITLNKGAMSELALHQHVENGQAALVIHYSAGL